VLHRSPAALRDAGGDSLTQPELVVGFGQPEQPAVTGQLLQTEARFAGSRRTRKGHRWCGRLDHDDTSLDACD
jgi:hypothetical protein